MNGELKPEDQWDTEDRLDHLDGWHAASGTGFKSTRDPEREVMVYEPGEPHIPRNVTHTHTAADLIAAGRTARERHGEA